MDWAYSRFIKTIMDFFPGMHSSDTAYFGRTWDIIEQDSFGMHSGNFRIIRRILLYPNIVYII